MKQNMRNKESLRKMIDELLLNKESLPTEKFDRDLEELLEELAVYQQELEVQNEELRRIQLELDNSRLHYADLFENAPIGYVVFDENHKILSANNSFSSAFALHPADLIGSSIEKYIDPCSQDTFYFHLSNVMDKQSLDRAVLTFIANNKTVQAKVQTTVSKVAERFQFRMALNDISMEATMADMLDSAPNSIALHDFNGNFLYANKKTFEMHGYSESEFLSLNLRELDVPESAELIEDRMKLIKESGEANFEVEHFRKDGSRFPLLVYVKMTNWMGEPALMSIQTDITDRKAAERELRMQSLVLNQIADRVTVTDLNGIITYVNDAEVASLGYKREELIGSSVRKYGDNPEEGATQNEIIEQTIINGSWRGEVVNYSSTGEEVIFDCRTQLIQDERGAPVALSGVSTDITGIKNAMKALQESEANLKALINNADDIIVSRDLNGKAIVYNEAFAKIVHELYGVEAFPGINTLDYLNEPSKEHWLNILEGVHSGKKHRENFSWDFDGKTRHYDISIHPIVLDDRIIGSAEFNRDVTHSKISEIKLKSSNILLDSIRQAQELYLSNGDVRQVFMKLLNTLVGITDSQFGFLDEVRTDSQGNKFKLSLAITDLSWDSESQELYNEIISRKLEFRNMNNLAGFPARTGSLVIANDVKHDNRSGGAPEGHPPINSFMGIPIFFGGELVGVAGLANRKKGYSEEMAHWLEPFISTCGSIIHSFKQKEIEKTQLESLEESASMMDYLLNATPEAAALLNTKGEILHGNKVLSDRLNVPMEALIGKNSFDLLPPESAELRRQRFAEALQRKQAVVFEDENHEMNLLVYLTPILDGKGEVSKVVAYTYDITNFRNLEKELLAARDRAEEANRLKTNFLANMSHELRTTMNSILGFSDIIQTETDLNSIAEMSSLINKSGKRLLDTLNQILDLSTLEAGHFKPLLLETDISDSISNAVSLFSAEASIKNLSITFKKPESLIICKTDERVLRNILYNLLHNAVKFTESGGVEISLKEARSEVKNWLEISVKDTGIGIDKPIQSFIFDEFRQASEGINRSFEGSGLGLSICKKYAALLGGGITVESELGKGSTFTVSIPVTNDFQISETVFDTAPGAVAKTEELADGSDTPQRKALYVEDDELNALVVQRVLKKHFLVDIVATGQEAIDKARENSYSVILMDINLGKGMDGIETTQAIRAMPQHGKVPIVAVTAYAMKADREEFLSKGCTHYISKPFIKEELISTVLSAAHGAHFPKM